MKTIEIDFSNNKPFNKEYVEGLIKDIFKEDCLHLVDQYNIDKLTFLNDGAFAYVFTFDDESEKVIKITSNENDYKIAKYIKDNPSECAVKVFECFECENHNKQCQDDSIINYYCIISEKVEVEQARCYLNNYYKLIYKFTRLSARYSIKDIEVTIGNDIVTVEIIDYEEKYILSESEYKLFKKFLKLYKKIHNKLDLKIKDLHSANMGFDKEGNIKIFDFCC